MTTAANAFHSALNRPVSAKRLVMGMFGALDGETLPISKLIVGANLFDIEEPAVRMAANRLVSDDVLTLIERGWYGIGAAGVPLYEASRAWQRQRERLSDWGGSWVCVHVSHLGRSDRKALRGRLRALTLCGFEELEDGLWIRPANLSVSARELAGELTNIGLESGAVVLGAAELVHSSAEDLQRLWDTGALEASYQASLSAMKASRESLDAKPLEDAAREVHLIGSSVVSVLTHDPLLPASFVNADLRDAVHTEMLAYDELGKAIWTNLFHRHEVGIANGAAEAG